MKSPTAQGYENTRKCLVLQLAYKGGGSNLVKLVIKSQIRVQVFVGLVMVKTMAKSTQTAKFT